MTVRSTAIDIQTFLTDFERGWKNPHPHVWNHLLAHDVVLHQPLLGPITGRDAFADAYARLLHLIPDLTGQVSDWALRDGRLYVEMTLHGTLGSKPLGIELIDVLRIDPTGRISERHAYFDPIPALQQLLRSPRAWRSWWRSGIGPFARRRHLIGGQQ